MSPRSIAAAVTPAVLRWARETAGYALGDVAETLRQDAETVDQWERGELKPTVRQLEKLSEMYRRPLVTFFLPAPPPEPPLPADFRVLPADAQPLSQQVRFAFRRARRAQRIYHALASELNVALPQLPPRHDVDDGAERHAQAMRGRLGIGLDAQFEWPHVSAALRAWRLAVERLGVLVLQFSMEVDEVRGFSFAENGTPTIVMSTKDAASARIFTLFHEFAHVLLRTGGICIPDPGAPVEPDPQIEQYCNHFAGSLLVPLRPMLGVEVSRDDAELDERVRRLARDFKVSRYVILRRLLVAERLSLDRFRRTMERWRRQEPPPQRRGGATTQAEKALSRYGTSYTSLVLDAHERGVITSSDVSDFLSVKLTHVPEVRTILAAQMRA